MIRPCPQFGSEPRNFLSVVRSLLQVAVLGGSVIIAEARAGSIHIRWGPDASERLQSANVLLYEELVADRDAHESAFDREHPFYAAILSDSTHMDRLVERWQAHEERFEYWHPYLWRILDGYEHRHLPDPRDPSGGQKIGGHGGHGPNGGRGTGNGGGGVQANATPEPSSIVLLFPVIVLARLRNTLETKKNVSSSEIRERV